ncbi:MAG: DUF58 domain-containing protein [Prolixibacteraceae bacterium]|jgi:uncharacterized protein (DUF58 family)|nr:DUF58 domain-containing protein [Prolixibacteraceae bacterium]MBT6004663.1 DUF58 domain-containing protein [Prolixibacteraceae bacterium]MBT6766938.1 DUF58 domain-containing protein [Prolixibacteraceae bacterium]MBT6999469.1 DUF58 domain-containing protein [Prolixibacteraceae bacterium]MBT7396837.1 DUF58 domain-containing protein [Prolixibacteraceae bacterium]
METSELLKKVRQIEIKTRGLSRNIFAGEYHSAFKGRGMAFSEVREYQFGDDIRSIDWNVTARYNHPYVKIFEEERELTVMLLIDVSASREFGTFEKLKKNIITEISAILSFSAIQNNDKIGVIFFSNIIEKFIPPKKGKSHILRIIRELIDFHPKEKGTDITEALRYFTNAIKKRCTAFVISDFIDENKDLEMALSIANNKHDIVALKIYDEREKELPAIGMLKLKDAEKGNYILVDSSSKKTRKLYSDWWANHTLKLDSMFKRCGVDYTSINTNEDYVKSLMGLFKKRAVK